MHPLQGGVDGVAVLGRVVVAKATARLHAGGGDTVDDEAMLDDVVGGGECGVGRRLVAEQLHEADIVGAAIPDARRPWRRCFRGRDDGRERLVVHRDQFAGVERLVVGLCHDEGDVVANPAHAILRQCRVGRSERAAVAPFQSIRHRQIAPS